MKSGEGLSSAGLGSLSSFRKPWASTTRRPEEENMGLEGTNGQPGTHADSDLSQDLHFLPEQAWNVADQTPFLV